MIPRYSRPEMMQIWDDRHRYAVWLQVEMAVCQELVAEGKIPRREWRALKQGVDALTKRGGIDPAKVERHEAVTKHDIIAFTTTLAEEIGPVSRYVHFGLTSSDVVDTSLSLLINEAGEILIGDIEKLMVTLKGLAKRHQRLPTIGRSHGMFAEPTSFGLKFLGWYAEWDRNLDRLRQALERMSFGKLSGAVGVNAHWSPRFEERVLARLGLFREPVSTQVVPRDRHAEFLQTLAVCGASLERMAVELRHLQRSEVAEVREGFAKGQKGSSAMPHKRNPISSENVTGAARLLRAYAQASLENVALWHERDISHSSVERVVIPDATLLLDYAIHRMNGVLAHLVVDGERVRKNLENAGPLVYSGHYLLALVEAGVTREEAYSWVQECALCPEGDFVTLVATHPEISKRLSKPRTRELGSLKYVLRNVPEIYKRVLSRTSNRRKANPGRRSR
ncbi:MAG: adenylosuccinate lyase [Bdellovibrionales bacterium RIFOXYD1_FULL_55_31]|nr:MAG: adenylosuccinate lyase [Bdellovibrionales bacterium RIFOXYD1_FULL_55_31]